jgi:hypothetical protein
MLPPGARLTGAGTLSFGRSGDHRAPFLVARGCCLPPTAGKFNTFFASLPAEPVGRGTTRRVVEG